MKPLKYIRKDTTIHFLYEDGAIEKHENYHSLNEAKRKSRILQIAADGGLGQGSLEVIEGNGSLQTRRRFQLMVWP